MFAIVGAMLFGGIALMTLGVALGLPLGEFTMGGRHKILPKKMRLAAWLSLLVQIFGFVIILQTGGFMPLWFSPRLTRYICFAFALYLSLNTVMNFLSSSKKEKMVMTPAAAIAALCFWVVAINASPESAVYITPFLS